MTTLSTVDWIVIVLLVCLPLAVGLLAVEISARRDRSRWRDSRPVDAGRLSGRARW